MVDLVKRLLEFNAETGWTEEDVTDPEGGKTVFARFAQEILEILVQNVPKASSASMLIAGIDCGFLTPIAVWPMELKSQARLIDRAAADSLHANESESSVLQCQNKELHPLVSSTEFIYTEHLVLKIVGYGEYYGLIWFDVPPGHTFSAEVRRILEDALPALSRVISEANFSMRLQRLAAPMMEAKDGQIPHRKEIYREIVRQAALGLAADGAILRLYNTETKKLDVEAKFGAPSVIETIDLPIREQICKLVFESEHDFGTVHNILKQESFGVVIGGDEIQQLRDAGIASFMIMLLQSDVSSPSSSRRIGTLSVIHKRPHSFSRRDIRLARIFAERVADDLALLNQRDDLERKQKLLDIQSNMITRAEIVHLLVHDLGHRAVAVTERTRKFQDACKKAIRERRSPDFVNQKSVDLLDACKLLEQEVGQIRRIGFLPDESSRHFDLIEVIDEIKETMEDVMDRSSMGFELSPARSKGQRSNMILYGPKDIFRQAIFNLVINSLDAQRGRSIRSMIHIECRKVPHGDHPRVIIHFWDEGPGISYQHFPDFTSVFEIGSSSKPPELGSGTGLPVSRSLLDKYFRAEITILERKPPLFEIVAPAAL